MSGKLLIKADDTWKGKAFEHLQHSKINVLTTIDWFMFCTAGHFKAIDVPGGIY